MSTCWPLICYDGVILSFNEKSNAYNLIYCHIERQMFAPGDECRKAASADNERLKVAFPTGRDGGFDTMIGEMSVIHLPVPVFADFMMSAVNTSHCQIRGLVPPGHQACELDRCVQQ